MSIYFFSFNLARARLRCLAERKSTTSLQISPAPEHLEKALCTTLPFLFLHQSGFK